MHYFRHNLDTDLSEQLEVVLHGLLRAEDLMESKSSVVPPRVAVGFGACRDVIVPAIPTLAGVGVLPPKHKPKHVRIIESTNDLQNMFAYFFQHGAAAEYVFNMFMSTYYISFA